MKIKLFFCAVALFATSITAHATPASWQDEFDPDDILLTAGLAGHDSFTFTLDLRKGADGFRPGTDILNDALLNLVLIDDLDLSAEKVSFRFDGGEWTAPTPLIGGGFFPDLFVFSPLQFLDDGLLDVTIKATKGDFFFDNAFLAAFGDRADVPEPATVALFGAGLLGFGWSVRRRIKMQA